MTAAGLDRSQSVKDPWRISARELSAKKIQGSYAEWANTSAISIASEWFMPLSCAVFMLMRASPKLTPPRLFGWRASSAYSRGGTWWLF